MLHLLFPLLLSVGAQAADAPAPFAPPRLRIEPGGKQNLGEVGPREIRSQRYTFTNVSEAPIALRVLDLSPGVTLEGPALKGPLPAHATAEVTLALDPSDWVGRQSRNVRLGTDDPHQGSYFLPLEVVVRPDLTVDGDRRDLGEVQVPANPQAVFTFTRETGEALVLRIPQTLPPYLEMELQQGRNTAAVVLTLKTDRVAPGALLGVECLKVATNAPLQPAFNLYLSWKLRYPVEASPSRVVFTTKAKQVSILKLKARSGKPFRIMKAEVEGQGFRVARLPLRAAIEHDLIIYRTAVAQARAMLVVHVQGDEAPLKVPLAYFP